MLSVTTSGVYQDNDLYVEQGQSFTINCSASGGPNNVHVWKHNGVEISRSDEISNSNADFNISYSIDDTNSYSILSVNSVEANVHKGSYLCDVINTAGDHLGLLTIHGITDTYTVCYIR